MQDLLEQLRDIHVPPPVSWWPPAPGYWLVALLMILGVVLLAWQVRRYRLRRAVAREFERLFTAYQQHHDARLLAQQTSVLLRRAAVTQRPRQEAAGVTGDAWLALLHNMVAAKAHQFSAPVAAALTHGIYRADGDLPIEQFIQECRQWIRSLPPAGRSS